MNIIYIPSNIANYNHLYFRNPSEIKYIVIHYTGNNGDTAINNGNYFKKSKAGASAHYFVDAINICQSVKDENIAYHCGTKKTFYHLNCRNSNSIGIEMVSKKNSKGQYYIEDKVIENTIALVKELMGKYNIPITNVIRHYDVTHKSCPEPFVREPQQWKDFLSKLQNIEEEEEVEIKNKIISTPIGKQTIGMIEYNNTNYVPIRTLEKLFPIEVGFKNGNISIDLKPKTTEIIIDGKKEKLSTLLIFNRNYAGLAALAEALGYNVNYNSANGEITLKK